MSLIRKCFRIWRGECTLEIFLLEQHREVIVAGGLVYGGGIRLRYKIFLDTDWRVQKFHLGMPDKPFQTLFMEQVKEGLWVDGRGNPLTCFDGCTEIDISATPFTNTIPIRRMEINQQIQFGVVYIRVPELSVSSVQQIYTRKGDGVYGYENLDSGFCSDIFVDADQLVSEYPGLYHRIYAAD